MSFLMVFLLVLVGGVNIFGDVYRDCYSQCTLDGGNAQFCIDLCGSIPGASSSPNVDLNPGGLFEDVAPDPSDNDAAAAVTAPQGTGDSDALVNNPQGVPVSATSPPQPRPENLVRVGPTTPEEVTAAEIVGDAPTPEEAVRRVADSPDLPANYRIQALRALTQDECGEGMFSFFCTWFDRPQERAAEQLREGFRAQTTGNFSLEEHNEILRREARSVIPTNVPNCEDSLSSQCGQSLRNFDCQGDQTCEQSIELAQLGRQEALNQQRIPNSGMIRAAQMLRVSPQASATSGMIQNLLGIELSLIQEGSSIDQILKYGTPEQVCFAKVDSFISVNGLQVEGQVMEVDDETTGMSSVIRACDNRNFQICADLRAERSGIYFNNSFTLFVHLYVRNAEDFPQMVTVQAELKSGGGREEKINVVELSEDVPGSFILLQPGQTFSRTIYLPETQAFVGEENLKEIYGNVVMGVFEALGVSEQGNSQEQQQAQNHQLSQDELESLSDEELQQLMTEMEQNQATQTQGSNLDGVSGGRLVYALDYPILTLRGTSGSNPSKEVEMSGANMTQGSNQQSVAVVRRVSLD